jgi:hypothetical protein
VGAAKKAGPARRRGAPEAPAVRRSDLMRPSRPRRTGKKCRPPWNVARLLSGRPPVVAATDYVRAYPERVAAYIEAPLRGARNRRIRALRHPRQAARLSSRRIGAISRLRRCRRWSRRGRSNVGPSPEGGAPTGQTRDRAPHDRGRRDPPLFSERCGRRLSRPIVAARFVCYRTLIVAPPSVVAPKPPIMGRNSGELNRRGDCGRLQMLRLSSTVCPRGNRDMNICIFSGRRYTSIVERKAEGVSRGVSRSLDRRRCPLVGARPPVGVPAGLPARRSTTFRRTVTE